MLDLLDVDRVLRKQQPLGLGHVVIDQPADAQRYRCGKEQGLPLVRHVLHDLAHLDGKAHVEHAVRLVEHQHAQGCELETAAAQMVQYAARRTDDKMHPGIQAGELPLDRVSAVDRLHLDASAPADGSHLG